MYLKFHLMQVSMKIIYFIRDFNSQQLSAINNLNFVKVIFDQASVWKLSLIYCYKGPRTNQMAT